MPFECASAIWLELTVVAAGGALFLGDAAVAGAALLLAAGSLAVFFELFHHDFFAGSVGAVAGAVVAVFAGGAADCFTGAAGAAFSFAAASAFAAFFDFLDSDAVLEVVVVEDFAGAAVADVAVEEAASASAFFFLWEPKAVPSMEHARTGVSE